MLTLAPYQRDAVDDIHKKQGVAMVKGEVGCGKTIITLQYILETDAKKILVLCPKSNICDPWLSHIDKYAPQSSWTVTNYEKLLDDTFCKALLKDMPDAIICDEFTKVKGGTSKVAKRLRKLQPQIRIALAADFLPNSLSDCFSPVEWMAPGTFGTFFTHFKNKYCRYDNPHVPQQITGYNDEDYLMATLDSHTVRVDYNPDDYIPPSTREIIKIPMRPDEREMFEQLRQESILQLKTEKITTPNILSKLTRLIQLINDPALFGLSTGSKEETLSLILGSQELAGKVIVFSEHTEPIKRLQTRYGGVLYIGSMTQKQRTLALEQFKCQERILWASASGAKGLNIQHASTVIHMGLPFTHDMLKQRFGRVHRRGQTQETREIVLISEGSCDERVWEIIESKKDLSEKFNKRDYLSML